MAGGSASIRRITRGEDIVIGPAFACDRQKLEEVMLEGAAEFGGAKKSDDDKDSGISAPFPSPFTTTTSTEQAQSFDRDR